MPKTFDRAGPDVLDLLKKTMREYHADLYALEVRIGVRMVRAARNEHGLIVGHALTHAGAPCAAKIKLVARKDRVFHEHDLLLDIDADLWEQLEEPQRIALLDHELCHPVPRRDKEGGVVLTEDLRPMLKMRPDDWYINGFREVLHRHGANSMEWRSLEMLRDQDGNGLFEWAEEMAVRKAERMVAVG